MLNGGTAGIQAAKAGGVAPSQRVGLWSSGWPHGLLLARPLCESMLSHGGAIGAELSGDLGPVAGRAQLGHEGLQLLLLFLRPAA